jgi:hypothetical protein
MDDAQICGFELGTTLAKNEKPALKQETGSTLHR